MCSYFKRIIPNFSKTAEPLIALTRKYARFNWNYQCEKSYQDLKADLTKVPLLGYSDISSNFKIYTDASDGAIGAVSVQDCGSEDSIISGILIYVICRIKTCKSIGLPTARFASIRRWGRATRKGDK